MTHSQASLSPCHTTTSINNGADLPAVSKIQSYPSHLTSCLDIHYDNLHLSATNNAAQGSTDYMETRATLTLSEHVELAVRQYFSTLDGEESSNLYELILSEIEKPLLSVVLEYTQGNQSRCAKILGLNRGTLRTKLKTYHLIK